MQRSILITGCSSGIGYDAAHTLAKRGWRVFATARRPQDIAALEAEVAGQEAAQGQPEDAPAAGQGEEVDYVSLSQRVTPFIEMLQHCMRENTEVVWGV